MKIVIRGGESYDLATPAEIRQIVSDEQRAAARGIKWMRLPVYLQGKVSGSAIKLGVTQGQTPTGPAQGYVWGITRLVVTGLTASASAPDIVNLYLNDSFNGPIWWQFNGNTFGYNFSPPLVLQAGDTLAMQNSGSLTANGTITLSGEAWEVPAERAYRLLGL
jgi:hypothetical protein